MLDLAMFSRRRFIEAGIGLSALTFMMPAIAVAATGDDAELRAGAGRSIITLTGLFPIDEFTAEHDALSTRVLLTERGRDRQAIVVVDITSLTEAVITQMKAVVSEITGVKAECIIITASHTFSTPHIFIGDRQTPKTQAVLEAFKKALRNATQQAMYTLQPAVLGMGNGISRIGVSRDISTPYGWWLGADDKGITDPNVGVVTINMLNNQPLAVLINYAVQPAVMDASQTENGGRLVSADLAGAVSHYVERHFGDTAVAFYLVGCAGDQAPYLQASRHVVHDDGSVGRTDEHEKGFLLLALLGQKLGEEVIRITQSIKPEPANVYRIERHLIALNGLKFTPHNAATGPVTTFHYVPGTPVSLPVVLIQWGKIVMVGVQPELSAILGERIRAASPFAQTFVITMVDGAAKYLPDISGYQRFTYEARSSPFAPGEGEHAVQAIISLLTLLRVLPA
ncbi:hypothetical protein [Pantoea vagans]|uniref:hypothetical protein n=1 Tax=Pantoea vagans TaxID=470934 RepID=UPI00301A16E5